MTSVKNTKRKNKPGAGRPMLGQKARVPRSFKLDPDTDAKLQRLADAKGKSKSQIIHDLIEACRE